MLYFSKTKLIIIYSVIFFLALCTFTNFFDDEENFFLSKKINLGLDLQGGSYLLLEVNSDPVTKIRLQQKLIDFRKIFKKNNIKYKNLKLINQSINFQLNDENIKKFENFFLNKKNSLHIYYNQ